MDSNQIVSLQKPPLSASLCTLLELKTAVTVDALRQESFLWSGRDLPML
ncbi:hypothetical protein AVDCRST_MAG92-3948 [uncultured Coleofasciculus sp.]|uniref:Uncharacterized protein n=1 Tax=uncultured Coleofasciculus sp. TaxID=1267456 RepID=A0A6J4JRX6_9CYAN|nr:hypothetical protein AVDCRST_MAG92-3948 [uncultured Coleofasciculus sp.]